MKSHILNGRWAGAFLLIAVALFVMPAAPAQAGKPSPPPPPDPGMYLIISVDTDFDTTTTDASDTVIIRIGSLVTAKDAGTIFSTRYVTGSGVSVKLPKNKDLSGNAFTIVGAIDAPGASVHLISTDGDPVPRKVQEAFFIAEPEFLGQGGEFENQFPSTVEIAQFIYDTATASTDAAPPPDETEEMGEWLQTNHTANDPNDPRGPALTVQQILENIFSDSAPAIDETTGDVAAEAEGDLYPHPDDSAAIFGFDFSIQKQKGKFKVDSNMELDVVVDVKPGNADNVIEKTDNGVVWVAILTTTETVGTTTYVVFNAADEVDTETVILREGDKTTGDGSSVEEYKKEDVDHDGYDDITMKFRVADIGLTSNSTKVTLTGKTTASVPMGITGSDLVTVKK